MDEKFLKEMQQLLKEEYPLFLDAYNQHPKKSIYLQLDKINCEKWEEIVPFGVKKIPIVTGGYYVEERLGNHPYHHAGLFYIQEPSAMLPPLLTSIPRDAKVLDLCASPGGKTNILSSRVPNGFVIANEFHYNRAKKLLSNVERLGLKNVIVSSSSSKELRKKYAGYFDVILIDAPCSGEGMFRKDEKAIKEWSLEKVEELCKVQKELLEDSHFMLKKDGILIYSTCTFTKEENEEQIVEFLKKHQYEILDTSSILEPYTKPGLSLDSNYKTEKARRCYPHIYGEGQFMIALKKIEEESEKQIQNGLEELTKEEEKIIHQFIKENLKKDSYIIKKYQNNIIILPYQNIEVPKQLLLSCFVKMGEIRKNRFIPHHQFIKAYGTDFFNICNLKYNDEKVISYLKGEEIIADVKDGYGVICVDGYPLGLFKAKNQKLKNHYPKGLRYQGGNL